MKAKRLLKLAAHLRKPAEERLHPKFNFRAVNRPENYEELQTRKGVHNCGTLGCGMGETPLVFPRLIKFYRELNSKRAVQFCIGERILYYKEAAVVLFDISFEDAEALFTPRTNRWWAPGVLLGSETTAEQLAESIEQCVAAVRALPRRKAQSAKGQRDRSGPNNQSGRIKQPNPSHQPRATPAGS